MDLKVLNSPPGQPDWSPTLVEAHPRSAEDDRADLHGQMARGAHARRAPRCRPETGDSRPGFQRRCQYGWKVETTAVLTAILLRYAGEQTLDCDTGVGRVTPVLQLNREVPLGN